MTLRSLLINVAIAAGTRVGGALFTVVLHLAGMPLVLCAASAVLVGSAAVLLAGLTRRDDDAQDDDAADAEEVSA